MFNGTVRKLTFKGTVRKPAFKGTVRKPAFNGTVRKTAFNGTVRKDAKMIYNGNEQVTFVHRETTIINNLFSKF